MDVNFFHYKRTPKNKITAKHYRFLDYFCRFVFNFKLFKMEFWQKKISAPIPIQKLDLVFGFSILKPGFGRTLIPSTIKTQMNLGSFWFKADCAVRAVLKMSAIKYTEFCFP